MDGLTRLKHNVCGPGLCETRMHAYMDGLCEHLPNAKPRRTTTSETPVWSRWSLHMSLQPGRRDQPAPRNAAHASSQSRSSFHNNKRYCTLKQASYFLGLLACTVML